MAPHNITAGQTKSMMASKAVQIENPNRNKTATASPIMAQGQSQLQERQRPRLSVILFAAITTMILRLQLASATAERICELEL